MCSLNRSASCWLAVLGALLSIVLVPAKRRRMTSAVRVTPTSVAIVAIILLFQLPAAAEQDNNVQERLKFELARSEQRIIELEQALQECRDGLSQCLLRDEGQTTLGKLHRKVDVETARNGLHYTDAKISVSALVQKTPTRTVLHTVPPIWQTVPGVRLPYLHPLATDKLVATDRQTLVALHGNKRQLLTAKAGC